MANCQLLSLYQPHLLRDCQLSPLDRQTGGIDHLVFINERAQTSVAAGCIVRVHDFPGSDQFLLRGCERTIDDWNLVGMNGPLSVKAHARRRAGVMLALFRSAQMRGYAINY